MTSAELLADSLKQSAEMFKMTLADFSEQEMLVRPVPAANHANWQIGHLVRSGTTMLNGMGGSAPELPAGFADRYTKTTSTIDDPKQFATKADLMAGYEKLTAAAVQFAASLKPEDLGKPGPEMIRQMSPTVGSTLFLLANHAAMHVGQFQVIRRKLGKPILF